MTKKERISKFIGNPIFFSVEEGVGEIGMLEKVIETPEGTRYWVSCTDELPPTKHYLLTEDQILEPDWGVKKYDPIDLQSDWIREHLSEINEAFGFDVSGYVLIIEYDSFEQVLDDWPEYAIDKKVCQFVAGKWVFIAC